MREYYDRGLPAAKILPATRDQQDAYWLLRSQLTQALARDWDAVREASPEVAKAADDLNRLVDTQPSRAYRIFRPEDASAQHHTRPTTSSGRPPTLFLR